MQGYSDLIAQDTPLDGGYSMSRIVRISKTPKQPYYTTHVPGVEHYYANGILHHNSGKTYIIIRQIVIRALLKPSAHVICRLRFNHVKTTIFYKTFPDVMRECFPGVQYEVNRGDWFMTLRTFDGGESTIWLAGTDDPARMEKVLGTEFSTVFLNEISQIPWEVVETMWTRLAENSGLKLRFYYDCNPPFKRHWSYTMFFKSETPKGEKLMTPIDPLNPDSELVPLEPASMLMNPSDNPHLPPAYIGILNALPKRARDRYRDGIFLSDVEGALWTDEMIIRALQKERGELIRKIVAVDPAISVGDDSSEWGIVICGLDEFRHAGIIADESRQIHVTKAAQAVVNLYHQHDCNVVVAEVNQGGDMVEALIHNVDPHIKVIKVRASTGKFARAEPVSQLYELGEVWHDHVMPELEDQFTTYVPHLEKRSPDRLDAAVWGLTYLAVGKTAGTLHFG